MVNTRFGWGYHVWDIERDNIETVLKLVYSYAVVWLAANTTIKLSILLFYRRIFCPPSSPSPRLARLITFSMIGVLAWGIAFFFWAAFVCKPLKAYWSLLPIKGQKCYDAQGYKSYGFIDIALDVYLLILPQYKIWNMRMELHRKIAVGTVMSFALLAIVASVMRLPFIFKTMDSYDSSWVGMELTIWSSLELTLGIACTCAPALRAFFTRKNLAVIGRMHTLQDTIEQSVRSEVGGTTRKTGQSKSEETTLTLSSGDPIERRESDRTLVEEDSEKAMGKHTTNELDNLEWPQIMPPPGEEEDVWFKE
jgi:hypothetical protein